MPFAGRGMSSDCRDRVAALAPRYVRLPVYWSQLQPDPGRDLLEYVEPLIYSTTLDFRAVEAVSETRARIHEKLSAKRADTGLDITLARGGMRPGDVRFVRTGQLPEQAARAVPARSLLRYRLHQRGAGED